MLLSSVIAIGENELSLLLLGSNPSVRFVNSLADRVRQQSHLLCLVSGYEPEKGRLPIEADWPNVIVVTEIDDPDFCARLAFEVQSRGFQIIRQVGQTETPLVSILPGEIPPLPTNMPPARNAFRLRVETPLGYPPEAAYHLEQMKSQLERDLLSALGYSVKKRLRRSPLVSKAEALQVGSQKLPKRGLYDIVVKNYRPGSAKKDEERAKLLKSRRHSLRKRLIDPYKHDKKTE